MCDSFLGRIALPHRGDDSVINGVVRINLTEQVFPNDPVSGEDRRVVARLAMGISSLIALHKAWYCIPPQLGASRRSSIGRHNAPSEKENVMHDTDKKTNDSDSGNVDEDMEEIEISLKLAKKVRERRLSNPSTLAELQAKLDYFDDRQRARWKGKIAKGK